MVITLTSLLICPSLNNTILVLCPHQHIKSMNSGSQDYIISFTFSNIFGFFLLHPLNKLSYMLCPLLLNHHNIQNYTYLTLLNLILILTQQFLNFFLMNFLAYSHRLISFSPSFFFFFLKKTGSQLQSFTPIFSHYMHPRITHMSTFI